MKQKEAGHMNKKVIDEMIERQGVYEITYKKDEDVKIRHISNMMLSPNYGDSYISAYCHEACKELIFNTKKILSIKEYWIGILSKGATAPKEGLYLIANAGLGQGIDIYYHLLELKEGDPFEGPDESWSKPIAYHFIPSFIESQGKWIEKEILLKKWENEIIPAPEKGIPIIVYQNPQENDTTSGIVPVEYCIGNEYYGGQKIDDITAYFKEWDSAGPFGWSEHYDGYKILGFMIVCEYDVFACRQHINQRIEIDPGFLSD